MYATSKHYFLRKTWDCFQRFGELKNMVLALYDIFIQESKREPRSNNPQKNVKNISQLLKYQLIIIFKMVQSRQLKTICQNCTFVSGKYLFGFYIFFCRKYIRSNATRLAIIDFIYLGRTFYNSLTFYVHHIQKGEKKPKKNKIEIIHKSNLPFEIIYNFLKRVVTMYFKISNVYYVIFCESISMSFANFTKILRNKFPV